MCCGGIPGVVVVVLRLWCVVVAVLGLWCGVVVVLGLWCVVVVVLGCAAYPPLCRAVSNVPIVRVGIGSVT